MDVLKDFYWQSYQIVQKGAPHWITLLHDSFRLSVGVCVYVWLLVMRLFSQLYDDYNYNVLLFSLALIFHIAQH